jgi:hypothetical protein
MNTTDSTPPREPRRLTDGELRAAVAVAVMVAALGILGFVNSFRAVARAAGPSFGPLAPTVPLGTDLAIAVFSAMDLVLARLDMRPRWVRLVPWTLTAATIYLNVAGEATWFGRIAHAVFPALWVLAVSLGAHVTRVRAQLTAGTRIDRIRPSRWLLAPFSTAALWRRMVLWEIRSYPDALAREQRRLLALTDLQDAYGLIAWRWRAPRRVRVTYRLGQHPAGPVREDPRTDPVPALAPARTDPPLAAPLTDPPGPDAGTRTEPAATAAPSAPAGPGAPLASVARPVIVAMLAGQLRDAVDTGQVWRPDYEALMASTGRRRSWCEKAVRDARNLMLTLPQPDSGSGENEPGDDAGTGGPAVPRLHPVPAGPGEDDPDDTRTGEPESAAS